jgi:Mg2+ and Co2+ transporter CorA
MEKDATGLREIGLKEIMDERDMRYEARFVALDLRSGERYARMAGEMGIRFDAAEKALMKVDTATEKRFESVNEFREALRDQNTHMITKDEANAKFDDYNKRMEKVDADIRTLREFKSGSTVATHVQAVGESKERNKFEFNINTVLALFAILATILLYFAKH